MTDAYADKSHGDFRTPSSDVVITEVAGRLERVSVTRTQLLLVFLVQLSPPRLLRGTPFSALMPPVAHHARTVPAKAHSGLWGNCGTAQASIGRGSHW